MSDNDSQTVFIVDDDPALRDSVATLLGTLGLATRTFESAEEFLEALDPTDRGCVLLDVRMSGMSGLELQRHLARTGISIPVILITAHGDVPMAVQAMREGAFDFIEKPFKEEDLLEQVHACLKTDSEQVRESQAQAEARARMAQLTEREREVLEQVVEGQPSKLIADTLGISVRTVDVHRANILKKMRVRTVAEVVRLALLAQGPGGEK